MTLSEYIIRRNGVPMGSSKSLRNNLHRSFGAKNFATFWNFWNPIFGYYLGQKIFKPLKTYFTPAIALVMTFIFCGLLHDTVTTLFRGSISLFFTLWFLLMGLIVLLTTYLKQDLSHKNWMSRAFVNLAIILVTFSITKLLYNFIEAS
jgi:hypothetical protein